MSTVVTVPTNITGLRYCQELSLGVLDPTPANQRWVELEPNSYPGSFGGKVTTIARNPINPGRQRKKGTVTNIEGSGGFNTDLTQKNLQDLFQGFFFADLRRKAEYGILSGLITAVATSDDSYAGTGIHSVFKVGDLILAAGFTNAGNDGLKHVANVGTTGKVKVTENLVDEGSPPTDSSLVKVGFQFATGDATIDISGTLPKLVTVAKDLTELGLTPGEPVYIGGDASATKFFHAADNGWARVRSVTAHALTFDKTTTTMLADDGTDTGSGGTGKTIRIFFGRVVQNEVGTLIKRRTYTLERTLGFSNDADQTKEQAEYLNGSVPNQATWNVKSADKATVDLSFVAQNSTTLDENNSVTLLSKVGGVVRVPALGSDAFNTSSDMSYIRLSVFTEGTTAPAPLFAFADDLSLVINNNVKPNTALGVTGAFEMTPGNFEVGGTITAYFATVAGIQAVRDNDNVTLDFAIVKANAGIAVDVPLIALGGGQPNLTQNEAIKIPLDNAAATGFSINSGLNHTLLVSFFDYLPDAAE